MGKAQHKYTEILRTAGLFRGFLCLVLMVGTVACGEDRFEVDVSGIDLSLEVERLDQDLFSIGQAPTAAYDSLNRTLKGRYGGFYEIYVADILKEGMPNDPMLPPRLKEFVEDPVMQDIQMAIDERYADFSDKEKALTKAFKHYRYHFPDSLVPRVVTYNSGFNYGIYPTDSLLGIGLEWYLGPGHEVTQRLSPQRFPQYVRADMRSDYLVTDAVKGWLQVKFYDEELLNGNMLDRMVFYGKILYLTDALFPYTADSTKIKYSSEEIRWCRNNEHKIWRFFVDQELLFTNDAKEIRKMIEAAPFTTGLPRKSPGRIGKWVGWRIVRSYMREYPEKDLRHLLKYKNSKRMLDHYKPSKQAV